MRINWTLSIIIWVSLVKLFHLQLSPHCYGQTTRRNSKLVSVRWWSAEMEQVELVFLFSIAKGRKDEGKKMKLNDRKHQHRHNSEARFYVTIFLSQKFLLLHDDSVCIHSSHLIPKVGSYVRSNLASKPASAQRKAAKDAWIRLRSDYPTSPFPSSFHSTDASWCWL